MGRSAELVELLLQPLFSAQSKNFSTSSNNLIPAIPPLSHSFTDAPTPSASSTHSKKYTSSNVMTAFVYNNENIIFSKANRKKVYSSFLYPGDVTDQMILDDQKLKAMRLKYGKEGAFDPNDPNSEENANAASQLSLEDIENEHETDPTKKRSKCLATCTPENGRLCVPCNDDGTAQTVDDLDADKEEASEIMKRRGRSLNAALPACDGTGFRSIDGCRTPPPAPA